MKDPTRRDLAFTLVLPASLLAQETPPAAPADELGAARQQIQRNAEQLRAFQVPVATEPSIVFKP
ncbi:MAG TPA: hypothetical protein VEQ63_09205 [Bryobacteraceae bacterium]|nr:hypothetical protein [Bryobacteraceae bacterium]